MGHGVGWQARLGVDWMGGGGGAVEVAAACQGRVTAAAGPPLFLPPDF